MGGGFCVSGGLEVWRSQGGGVSRDGEVGNVLGFGASDVSKWARYWIRSAGGVSAGEELDKCKDQSSFLGILGYWDMLEILPDIHDPSGNK